MSYCVNCGVELEQSLKQCPLCNTPVINPREMMREKQSKKLPPFPEEKGQVEMVKRKDVAILLTTVMVATSVVCGLLNLLVYSARPWSLAVIGACILLWVILIPVAIYTGQPIYTSVLLDGLGTAIYLYMLTFLSGSKEWFWRLGMPIVVLITLVAEFLVICLTMLPRSFLTNALYSFTVLAAFCIGLEILIDRYIRGAAELGWSAIVLTVCIIVNITIITLLSRKRLRNAVRKRLHF